MTAYSEPDRLREARRQWGVVFSDFRLACEMVNGAWYQVEDRRALMEEDVHRLRAIQKNCQKEIDAWEARMKQWEEVPAS